MSSAFRVLCVDDEKMTTRMLLRIFKNKYTIAVANSGKEALDIVPTFRPDMVLLDILMPIMNGYEVCRKIRADKRFSMTKIILISGKSRIEERLEGYEAGADDFVIKPFVKEELEAKVKVFLQLKRAEEVDKIKGDLLTLFSHETKTPLSGIIGLSELIRDDKSLGDSTREYAKLIHECGDQLLDFVSKTSLLCELKTGLVMHYDSGSLVRYLNAVVEMAQEKALKRKITVELDIEKDIHLNADWKSLKKVFNYLLDNAIKFSPEGDCVVIRANSDDGNCLIQFIDKGKGIDPEWIDSIFDEFAIQDIDHHKKGQGLSLAISKHIIGAHKGSIQAESTTGNGATLTISLPVEQPGM